MDPQPNLTDVGNSQSYLEAPALSPRAKTSIRFSLGNPGSSNTLTRAESLEDRAKAIFGTSLPKASFKAKHVESSVDPQKFRQILGNDELPFRRLSSQEFFRFENQKV